MKINKYNKPKSSSTSDGRGGGVTIISGGGSGGSADYCDVANRLDETHTIFGQPFNGTQDVSGDLTDVTNITAIGGDITVKAGDDGTGGNVIAENNVIGKRFIGDVDAGYIKADNADITNISGSSLKYDDADIKNAIIEALQSTEITTDYLTVTKQAHFFELIIDKIKAAGGAVLLTPADGFKVDKVKEVNYNPRFYKLYWKATDGEKQRKNMWQVGDQAICQTFNAAEGVNYNISNKYYWSLVTAVGIEKIDGDDYNYIEITGSDTINNKSDYDGVVNPEVGDEIAMLGYRGTDDASRQSAIYLAAYHSLDPTLKAPLFCHYKGINDFNLSEHKFSWFAANGNTIRGNLKVESGEAVEDMTIKIVSTTVEYAVSTSGINPPSAGWQLNIPSVAQGQYLWTRTTVNYSDGHSTISYSVGRQGADGAKGDKGNAGNDGTSCNLNLLYGTKDFSGDKWENLQYWEDTGEYYNNCRIIKRSSNQYGVYQRFVAEAGKKYTFSAYLKSDGGDARYYFTITDANGVVTPLQKDVPESTIWSRQAVSFTCTTSGEIACRVQKAAGTGAIYVAGYKLEEGDNESNTIWLPHPSEMLGVDTFSLNPVYEQAEIRDNVLYVRLQYEIQHKEGDKTTIINPADEGLNVRAFPNTDTSKIVQLTYNSGSNNVRYFNDEYLIQWGNNRGEEPDYFTVELLKDGAVLERRLIYVKYTALALFEITDKIRMKVQDNEQTANTNKNKIAELELTADGLKSTVKEHTDILDGIDEGETVRSIINQTARQILLQVDDIALKIDNQKIVLDGNTEINGSLTLDNTDQGFILKGQGGITQITPQSIKSYEEFSKRANLEIPLSSTSNQAVLANSTITKIVTFNLGAINNNVTLSLKNGLILTNGVQNYGTTRVNQIYYKLKKDGSTVKQYFIENNLVSTPTIFDYTTTQAGNYAVEVQYNIVNPSGINDTYEMKTSLTVVLPSGCFNLIGYDGIGMNFGNQRTVFFSGEGAFITYGDNQIKVDSTGIYKYAGDASIQPVYQNKGAKTDTATSRYMAEYAPLNGCVVRRVTTGGTTYLQPNDEYINPNNYTGTLTIVFPEPSKNIGRRIYVKKNGDGGTTKIEGTFMQANTYSTSLTLDYKLYTLISDGTYWNIV